MSQHTTFVNETIEMAAQTRDGSQNPRQLRSSNWLPGTVYHKSLSPSLSIQVPMHEFTYKYNRGARVFRFSGLEKPITVKAHQVQYHHVSLQLLNVEFLLVDSTAQN
ncbi:MAG: hypothetical protein SFZ03_00275 [Candidatus Melainabacteria bacterium]|nr:hypothetical protein [Candidatus Melainabacteria bacterium]